MAKGMRVKLNYEVSRDPDTGAEITRLTPPEVTCHRNYFYQKCFFNDGSHLLFAGEFDGNWNYYLLDLAKAEAVQLTEGAGMVIERTINRMAQPFLLFVDHAAFAGLQVDAQQAAMWAFVEEIVENLPVEVRHTMKLRDRRLKVSGWTSQRYGLSCYRQWFCDGHSTLQRTENKHFNRRNPWHT